jgi:hypothetical protein
MAALFVVGPSVTYAGEITWPDDAIPVPHLVDSFIVAECADYAGTTDEDIDACIAGERFGYRATVMMLSDSEIGEYAAERYRACRAGLGAHEGRFHRRRAECIGSSFHFVWRFESTRQASLPEPDPYVKTAVENDPSTRLSAYLVSFTKQTAQDRQEGER